MHSSFTNANDKWAVVLCNTATYSFSRCLEQIGRQFQPYILQCGRNLNRRLPQFRAENTAALKVIVPSRNRFFADILHLAIQFHCVTVSEVSVGFVVLHACEALLEDTIWLVLDSQHPCRTIEKAAAVAKSLGRNLHVQSLEDEGLTVSLIANGQNAVQRGQHG